MKTLTQLFLVIVLATSGQLAFGQTQSDDVTPCTGNQNKTVPTTEMLTLFNQLGINLNKYQWDNSLINCHINSAIQDYEHYQFNLRTGGYLAGIGLAAIPVGIAFQSALGSGAAIIVVGVAVLAGGTALIVKALQRKKSHDLHVAQVGNYYRQKNL